MMRFVLEIIGIFILYYTIKTVLGSAIRASREEHASAAAPQGKEMVLDPECRTYIVKDRALSRRLGGRPLYFCSEACARHYEEKHRG